MSNGESGPQFNEYQRNYETTSWQDVPVYAKEILLELGNYQEYEKRTVFDHSWIDPDTDDSIRVSCHNFRDASLYIIEVNKGDEIDSIRKYGFQGDKQGISVYDTKGNEMEEEQEEQAYLESYLNDRLRTSGVRDFEISHEGNDQFWLMSATNALLSQEVDDKIRNSMCAPEELKMEYRSYIVDTVISNNEHGYIPKTYLYQALAKREVELMSRNQLES